MSPRLSRASARTGPRLSPVEFRAAPEASFVCPRVSRAFPRTGPRPSPGEFRAARGASVCERVSRAFPRTGPGPSAGEFRVPALALRAWEPVVARASERPAPRPSVRASSRPQARGAAGRPGAAAEPPLVPRSTRGLEAGASERDPVAPRSRGSRCDRATRAVEVGASGRDPAAPRSPLPRRPVPACCPAPAPPVDVRRGFPATSPAATDRPEPRVNVPDD